MFNINDYLTPEVVSILITAVIIPALIKGLNLVAQALENKIKNDNYNKYITAGEKAIETAVTAVGQTYVDSLKKSGSFDKAAQAEAFEQARQKTISILGTDAKQALTTIYGDLDTYISSRLEYYVKQNKATTTINTTAQAQ